MKLEFAWQIFHNYSNKKFHENSSIESQGFPYGQTDRRAGGQADRRMGRQILTKLAVKVKGSPYNRKTNGPEGEKTYSSTPSQPQC
jgi:hypothetical protein